MWIIGDLTHWLIRVLLGKVADGVISDPTTEDFGPDPSEVEWDVDVPTASFEILLPVNQVQEPVMRLAAAFPHLKIDALKRFAERIVNLPHGKSAQLQLQVGPETELQALLTKALKDQVALDFRSSDEAIAKLRNVFQPPAAGEG